MKNNFRYLIAALSFFAAPITASAQNAAPAPAADIEAQTATPAMWRVADADSEYILLGTFHILPREIDWWTPALRTAFDDAKIVYFEMEADDPNIQQRLTQTRMTKGYPTDGGLITDRLSAQDATLFTTILTELQLNFQAINVMMPWQAFFVMNGQFLYNHGLGERDGVDKVLLAGAKVYGKDVRFFESFEENIGAISNLSPKGQERLLSLTIRDWEHNEQSFDELFSAWMKGDVTFLDEQMNNLMREEAPEVYEHVITARNRLWADELDAALKNESGKGLIAVGAAHLVGDISSVPALLAAKGYEVSRYGIEPNDAANDNTP